MSHLHLRTVLVDLSKNLSETGQLAAASQQWVSVSFPRGVPKFTAHHKDTVTKFAFLQAFLALEAFLEDSFLLYLLGKNPPVGRRPHRLLNPATRKEATRMLVGEKSFVEWAKWDDLDKRASFCFRDGRPYSAALAGQKGVFREMNVLRNAIAHSSAYSHEAFKKLVRDQLRGAYPPRMTVGRFLATIRPGTSPPQSFLEYYLDRVNFIAGRIVPT